MPLWKLIKPGLYQHTTKPFIYENGVLKGADGIPALDYNDLVASPPFITPATPLYAEFAYTQPPGTPGGMATPAVRQVYPLNTELSNDSPTDFVLDPLTGVLTLTAGDYTVISGHAVAYKINDWVIDLYDNTGAGLICNGFIEYCDLAAGASTVRSFLRNIKFTLAVNSDVIIQYLCSAAIPSITDLGIPVGATYDEQYGYLKLMKTA